MEEPQNPHFYDFWISGRVQTLPNQLFISLEPPGHLKQIKKIHGTVLKVLFYKSQNVGNPKCQKMWKWWDS